MDAFGSGNAVWPTDVLLVSYDNRVEDGAASWPSELRAPLLQRTSRRHGVPIRWGGRESSSAAARKSKKGFQQADRIRWQLRTLASSAVSASTVVLLDSSDTICCCSAAELAARTAKLLEGRTDHVLVGGEFRIWPRDTWYNSSLTANAYPRAPSPGLRYINVGAAAGSPAALAGVLRCMAERYGFPSSCPSNVRRDGSYEFLHGNMTWRPRPGGRSYRGDDWGWEQACWHTYLLEQRRGRMPPDCPKLVLDYGAQVILHMNNVAQDLVWRADAKVWLRPTNSTPCIVHAEGSSKYLLPSIAYWLDAIEGVGKAAGWPPMRPRDAGGTRANASAKNASAGIPRAPHEASAAFSRDYERPLAYSKGKGKGSKRAWPEQMALRYFRWHVWPDVQTYDRP